MFNHKGNLSLSFLFIKNISNSTHNLKYKG